MRRNLEAFWVYFLSQKIECFCKNLTFLEFESDTNAVYECLDFPYMADTFLGCLGEYTYIVQVDQCELTFYICQASILGFLRGFRRVPEFE